MLRSTRLAGVLGAALLLAACGGDQTEGSPSLSGSDGDTSTGSAQSAPSGKQGAAPRVPNPLPVDGILADPCNALSAAQLSRIGLDAPGTKRETRTGSECVWKSAAFQDNSVSISPMTANDNGLDGIYANEPEDEYFEPTTIGGYPAVYANVIDSRSNGDCVLWVGVTDELAVSVITQIARGPNETDPCPVNERVGTAMIEQLGRG
ncbi:DUF3558 domain-containing protein [Amycolatopsis cihanbeyliensis]|uniref:Uncharacterized protein DUF3558 n=1 Tax=Amycolatopsis cihanbeyliensis TaxID=1128664 RepID=A0A542DL38_AMYCI|nr:DUF3558 domain-containing protein [Amycolatopsis cihanbeyliensis]TQJ03810.1 uncharacterized protein DUF3558 [Amycolatopsis cihanbeyliensis]